MTTVVVRSPDGTEQEHPLVNELSVGRGEGNDLCLTEGGVSRKHARLYVGDDGSPYVEDLGSANGTFVDGSPVQGPTPLSAEAEVTVGEYRILLREVGPKRPSANSGKALARRGAPAGDEEGPSRGTAMMPKKTGAHGAAQRGGRRDTAAAAEAAKATCSLKGLTGPWAGQSFPIHGLTVVGRVPGNQIVIDDGSVSRKHAELEPTPEGVVLRDAGSANGTLLNGEPVDQEYVLQPGDVVQFGVVEFAFETTEDADEPSEDGEDAALARAPVRRGGLSTGRGGVPTRRGRGGPEPVSPGRMLLYAALGMLVLVGLGVWVFKTYSGPADQGSPDQVTPLRDSKLSAGPTDTASQLQEDLTECRSFASTDTSNDPNWAKAEQACGKALNLEPINAEALGLVKHIEAEKQASEIYQHAEKDLLRLKTEEALDLFAQLPESSYYYRKAKPEVMNAIAGVKKKAADDCKAYAHDGHPAEALPRCERYMTYACQEMSQDELLPPVGYKVVLNPGRLRKREWRPKDPVYLLFLKTRAKEQPGEPAWQCPVIKVARRGVISESQDSYVQESFAKRFPDKAMQRAMMDYWRGAANEANAILQHLRLDMHLASLHKQAEDLGKQITTVDQLYKAGEGQLQVENPAGAAESFDEALTDDQTLMGDQALERPSFYRRNIQQDMASAAYKRGKELTQDRHDAKQGCEIWRLGAKFYRGNIDLMRALTYCSGLAGQGLQAAKTCAEIDAALEFAVDGDGFKERSGQMKKDMKCQ